MKKMFLCASMHHRELVKAATPSGARTFMQNAHPDDGEYRCYAATEDDLKLFKKSTFVKLAPRKRFNPEQLDLVGKPKN